MKFKQDSLQSDSEVGEPMERLLVSCDFSPPSQERKLRFGEVGLRAHGHQDHAPAFFPLSVSFFLVSREILLLSVKKPRVFPMHNRSLQDCGCQGQPTGLHSSIVLKIEKQFENRANRIT